MLENFTLFAEVLSQWDGYEKYAERLKSIQPTFMERGAAIYRGRGFGFHVLNHGDFHYNNMLFKLDQDRRVEDTVFVSNTSSIHTQAVLQPIFQHPFSGTVRLPAQLLDHAGSGSSLLSLLHLQP